MKDVVRTRILLETLDDCEEVARAHGDRFRSENVFPANTLVTAHIAGASMLVEIEAWAEVGSGLLEVFRIVKS